MKELRAKEVLIDIKKRGVFLTKACELWLGKKLHQDGDRLFFTFSLKVKKEQETYKKFDFEEVLEYKELKKIIMVKDHDDEIGKEMINTEQLDVLFLILNRFINNFATVALEAAGKNLILTLSLFDFEASSLLDGGQCRGWVNRRTNKKSIDYDLSAGVVRDDIFGDEEEVGSIIKSSSLSYQEAQKILCGDE